MEKKRLMELAGMEQLAEGYGKSDMDALVSTIVKMIQSEEGDIKVVTAEVLDEINRGVKSKLNM